MVLTFPTHALIQDETLGYCRLKLISVVCIQLFSCVTPEKFAKKTTPLPPKNSVNRGIEPLAMQNGCSNGRLCLPFLWLGARERWGGDERCPLD